MFKAEIYLLIVLFTFLGRSAVSQEKLHVNRFTTQDGLPSNTIYSILEDKKGFLWIGTEFGVARYDGVAFKTFTAEDGLTDNNVLNIIEDNKGRIWFIHFASAPTFYENGEIYNKNNHAFLKLLDLSKLQTPPANFLDLKTKRLFFPIGVEKDSLQLQNIDGYRQDLIHLNENASGIKPNFFFNVKQHLFVLPTSGAQISNKKNVTTRSVYPYFLDKSKQNNTRVYFTNMQEQKSGWINLKTGDFIKKDVCAEIVAYGPYSRKVFLIHKSELSIWSKNLDTLIVKYQIPDGVKNIVEDQNGQLWMSGHHGLYMVTSQFTHNLFETDQKTIAFNSIFERNGVFLAGSDNQGIYVINHGQQKILVSDIETNRIHGFVNYKNRIIFGADGGIFEIKGEKIIKLRELSIKDIELDGIGGVLFASASGILRLRDNHFETLYNQRTTSVFQLNKSTIWLGTLNGMFEVKEKNVVVVNKIKTKTQLDFSNIKDIKRDQDGNIWIATHLDGLFMYNRAKGFVSVNSENCTVPIATNICLKLFVDENKLVWAATAKGITRIKKVGDRFLVENFSHSDGIIREDIHDLCVKSNKLYLATSNGCFEIKIPKPSTFNSIASIEKIWVNGEAISKNKTKFEHDENNFTFSIAASFTSAVNNKYHFKYKLEGAENQWRDLHSDEINLLNLNPGEYLLRVKPYSPKGGEVSEVYWGFRINKPWYNKWWFYVISIGLFLMIVVYFISRETKRIKASINLSRMELKVLRAQMNPHFIFNALNSIQHQLFSKDFKSANTFISKFAKLLRSNLHYSAQEFIDVNEEIAFLTNYLELEKYRFENLFDFEFVMKNFDTNDTFKLPPFMVQPLLENCIKHAFKNLSHGGKIKITFIKLNEHLLEISIEDNGKGIPENFVIKKSKNIGDSVGLGIISERIKILSRQHKSKKFIFRIENSENQTGTNATLILPILDL